MAPAKEQGVSAGEYEKIFKRVYVESVDRKNVISS